jgi:hypothetical protein
LQNSFIFVNEPKEKTSQYKGVCWHKQSHKWYARLHLKGQPEKYGGIFDDEMDAAKRVNQFCEEFGIPVKNPGISGIPNQSYQVTEKFALSHADQYYEKIRIIKN